MSTFHKMGGALKSALGVGLLAALGSLNGCMSAGQSQPSEDESVGQADEAIRRVTARYRCSMAAGAVKATLILYDNGTCKRIGWQDHRASSLYCYEDGSCPSCWSLANEDIGCELLN